MAKLYEFDWYCDKCNDLLNTQQGFTFDCHFWTCIRCGCLNAINEENILGPDYKGPLAVHDYWDEFKTKEEIDNPIDYYDLPLNN